MWGWVEGCRIRTYDVLSDRNIKPLFMVIMGGLVPTLWTLEHGVRAADGGKQPHSVSSSTFVLYLDESLSLFRNLEGSFNLQRASNTKQVHHSLIQYLYARRM